MRDQDLGAIVTVSYQAVSYFAGTNILTQLSLPDRLAICICFADETAAMVVCSIETSMVRTQTDVEELIEYTEFVDDPTEVLATYLQKHGVTGGRVGFEGRRLTSDSRETLRTQVPELTLVPIDDRLERAQTVKSQTEIDWLRTAGQSTLESVLTGIQTVSAGVSEAELAARVGAEMYRAGGMPSFTFFGAGQRALGAHTEPTGATLRSGELWRIDLGARFNETMNSDLARTGIVGEPSQEQEDILQNLLAIQAVGFAALEPGRPASDSFHAIRQEFDRRGMEFVMPHVGHGIGIGVHEYPILHPTNDTPLEVGTVVNIEPMYKALERQECYHVEDLAVVTDDGFELLTQPQAALLRVAG
jgi:Xaa-Pro aminopeptidase